MKGFGVRSRLVLAALLSTCPVLTPGLAIAQLPLAPPPFAVPELSSKAVIVDFLDAHYSIRLDLDQKLMEVPQDQNPLDFTIPLGFGSWIGSYEQGLPRRQSPSALGIPLGV